MKMIKLYFKIAGKVVGSDCTKGIGLASRWEVRFKSALKRIAGSTIHTGGFTSSLVFYKHPLNINAGFVACKYVSESTKMTSNRL